jgi:hypothetical protein
MRYLPLILPFILLGCHKGNGEPPEGPCGTVSGFQFTDVNGMQGYPMDSTDWRFTDDWCPAVEALFADRPPVAYSTLPPDSLLIIGYPNPTDNIFRITALLDDSSYMDIRFVDTQFHLIRGIDSLTANTVEFHADSMGISGPQLIRAYYRVVHSDGSAYRGHGDEQIGL